MITQVLKLVTPEGMEERMRAIPRSAHNLLDAEMNYISLCTSSMVRQLSVILISAVASLALLFCLLNVLVLFAFQALQNRGLSLFEVFLIEGGAVLLLLGGVAGLAWFGFARLNQLMKDYFSHWRA